MKKYLISIVIALAVLAVAWPTLAQREARRPREGRQGFPMFGMLSPEEAAKMREKWQSMSEEEREKYRTQMRERWEKMSDEEREKLTAQMRERFGGGRGRLSREEQLKAIAAIEKAVARLKAAIEATGPQDRTRFGELTEQQRTELREKMAKAREERQQAIEAIETELEKLKDSRQRMARQRESIRELNAIRELAVKEKAEQTVKSLDQLIEKRQKESAGALPGARPTTPRTPGGRRGEGTRRPGGGARGRGPEAPGREQP